jgi:GAF domain-containing protein
VVSAILCNYSRLKQDSWDRFQDDTWYVMQDFDDVCGRALAQHPLYERLVEYKIDGLSNQ